MRKKRIKGKHFKSTVLKLIKKHGKVRITFQDADYEPPCSCLCKTCRAKSDYPKPDLRRRILTKEGKCDVAYQGSDYHKFSGYSESCFMDDYGDYYEKCDSYSCKHQPKKTPRKTVEFMMNHDEFELVPISIEYGRRFKHKLEVV